MQDLRITEELDYLGLQQLRDRVRPCTPDPEYCTVLLPADSKARRSDLCKAHFAIRASEVSSVQSICRLAVGGLMNVQGQGHQIVRSRGFTGLEFFQKLQCCDLDLNGRMAALRLLNEHA